MAKVWNKQGVYCETAFDTLKNHWLFNPFSLNVHVFSEPPSRGDVWIPLSADLCSKVRFWSDFRCSKGPKTTLGRHFRPKRLQKLRGFRLEAFLEPTWTRTYGPKQHSWRQRMRILRPKTPQGHILTGLGSILDQLFDWFSQIVTVLLLRNCPGTVVRNCPGHNYLFFFSLDNFSTHGASRTDFNGSFGTPKRHQKTKIFRHRPKTSQDALTIDPGTPKCHFWPQNHDFWGPSLHRFFIFTKMAKVWNKQGV